MADHDAPTGVPEDAHADPEFARELEQIFQQAEERDVLVPEEPVDFAPYEDESEKIFIGREFTLEEFRRWFAVQKLGGRPFNAVGYHHTEAPTAQTWAGMDSLNFIFFKWYNAKYGWPWGVGPHLWVYSGDGPYSPGVPRIYVGTHPANDGIGIIDRNERWLHIEHIWSGDIAPFSDALKQVSGKVLGIVCAAHRHAARTIPLKFVRDGGVDNPGQPLGIMYHRDQNPNWVPGAWPKSCPGLLVSHENLDADLLRHAGGGASPFVVTDPKIVKEAGVLVTGNGALARPGPARESGEGRPLAAGTTCVTAAYTDQGQDIEGSPRWFRLKSGKGWIHATGGVYQPKSGATPGFVAEAKKLTVGRGMASVRPGPSRESGEPRGTLDAGSVHAVDGYTERGQEIEHSTRWYRLAGNAGWVHASGWSATSGRLAKAGGVWATLDGMNDEIAAAADKTGVPANLIKAMLAREGSFGKDWGRAPVFIPGRPSELLPFNGIFRTTAQSRGIDFDRMCRERPYAIWAMGEVLRQIKKEQGFSAWDDVAGYYFAGPNFNNPNWGDEFDSTVWNYKYGPSGVITRMNFLDSL